MYRIPYMKLPTNWSLGNIWITFLLIHIIKYYNVLNYFSGADMSDSECVKIFILILTNTMSPYALFNSILYGTDRRPFRFQIKSSFSKIVTNFPISILEIKGVRWHTNCGHLGLHLNKIKNYTHSEARVSIVPIPVVMRT